MSKDKGTKNTKKTPSDKSSGKEKVISDYKSEGKVLAKPTGLEAFLPKNIQKSGHKK